eukprot:9473863-Pyramimonas_sp.AAC.2
MQCPDESRSRKVYKSASTVPARGGPAWSRPTQPVRDEPPDKTAHHHTSTVNPPSDMCVPGG